jgi:hypothetical protein
MAITKISPAVVDFDAGITISTTDNSDNLTLTSTDADSSFGPNLNFYRNSSSPADDDLLAQIDFNGRNDNSQDVLYANIQTQIIDASDGTEDGRFQINTIVNGTDRNRFLLTPTETVFNDNSIDLDFRVESDGDANMLVVDGGNNRVGVGTSPDYRMHIFTSDSSAGAHANADDLFIENSSNAGMTIGSGTSSKGSIFFSDSDSSLSGQIEYRHSDDSLMLITGGSNRLHIQADGDLDIIDGNLVVASGHGINFAATGDGSGTDSSELLDDYEEGTWTPTIATGSITFSNARYTKVGRLIHISAQAQSPSDITTAAAVTIEGLPYPVHQSQAAGSVMGTYSDNTNATTVYVTDAEALYFYNLSNASWVTLRHDHFNSTSAYIYFQATYHTT